MKKTYTWVGKRNGSGRTPKVFSKKQKGFGALIRQKRVAMGLTQNEVAKKLGLTQAYIYRLEYEKEFPSNMGLLMRMISFFKLSGNAYTSQEGLPVFSPTENKKKTDFSKGGTKITKTTLKRLGTIQSLINNEHRIKEKWGWTHIIEKRKGVSVDLSSLKKGQIVLYGDGKTFHWLLTRKSDTITPYLPPPTPIKSLTGAPLPKLELIPRCKSMIGDDGKMIQNKNEEVNHPLHYGGADNIYEAIKVIRAWNLSFSLGNTVKYISRAGKKGENTIIKDLKKALWYLNEEIETLEKQKQNETIEKQSTGGITRDVTVFEVEKKK